MQSRSRFMFCIITFLLHGFCQAQPAPECLSVSEEGNSTIWKNTCDKPISVAFCSTGKPIWGKRCGDGAKESVYFTHMTTMKAGEKKSKGKDLKTAACKGALNVWDLKDSFSSDSLGRFDCYDPAMIKKSGLVPTFSRASGSTEDESCKNAHKLAGVTASDVTCLCRAVGRVQICQVTSFSEMPPNAASVNQSVKQYIREKISCAPEDADCVLARQSRKGHNGGTGLRD